MRGLIDDDNRADHHPPYDVVNQNCLLRNWFLHLRHENFWSGSLRFENFHMVHQITNHSHQKLDEWSTRFRNGRALSQNYVAWTTLFSKTGWTTRVHWTTVGSFLKGVVWWIMKSGGWWSTRLPSSRSLSILHHVQDCLCCIFIGWIDFFHFKDQAYS